MSATSSALVARPRWDGGKRYRRLLGHRDSGAIAHTRGVRGPRAYIHHPLQPRYHLIINFKPPASYTSPSFFFFPPTAATRNPSALFATGGICRWLQSLPARAAKSSPMPPAVEFPLLAQMGYGIVFSFLSLTTFLVLFSCTFLLSTYIINVKTHFFRFGELALAIAYE